MPTWLRGVISITRTLSLLLLGDHFTVNVDAYRGRKEFIPLPHQNTLAALTCYLPAHQGYKSFHDYTPPTPPSTSRFSPAAASTSSFPAPSQGSKPLPLSNCQSLIHSMSTPHRGLPPPAAMTLPQPSQPTASIGSPPLNQPPLSQSLGQLPAPPQSWQGAEDSMRNWLHAKAEEDKRKQEEEKTRQESLRLEQRKVEQEMLKASLSGGIPPYMIPMVFAGMGGGNLPNVSLEWAQHYMVQTHHLQQQQIQQQPQLLASQQTSPEQAQRQEGRPHAHSVGGQPIPVPLTLPSTPIGPPGPQQPATFLPSYQLSPASRSRQNAQVQATIVRPPPTSHLPRLNTGEMHIQPPPAGPSMQILPGQPSHPLQQTQSAAQQETQSSPSIYFHHWQPPISQAGGSTGGNQPTTPPDPTSSPKKRKATGPQQPAPPPTSQPQYTSPPFSQTGSSVFNNPFSQTGSSVSNNPFARRRGHSRQRSDISTRGYESYSRPASRHRHTESNFSLQSITSPRQPNEQGQTSMTSTEPRRRSGGSNLVSSLLEQSNTKPLSDSQSQTQTPSQQQSQQRDPQYSAAPEMRQEERHRTPENDNSRRSKVPKRDDGRD
ncbi:hypothetical protein BJ875DRAFT_11060 [Amylocarpus encephaloides]|uniref:Uncharacterized protein n=1 Tax=Amylocarpus encephaloides TaxID=45428 RepID=A0A9P7YK26_9HELO|nr:hypothetical protein BJ875DRAFT_11060 [Amylocarpus encephaloides]